MRNKIRFSRANVWDLYKEGYIICIPVYNPKFLGLENITGLMLEVDAIVFNFRVTVSNYINRYGFNVFLSPFNLISIPYKNSIYSDIDYKLVDESLNVLKKLMDIYNLENVVIPRRGWETDINNLKGIIKKYFKEDGRIIIC